MNRYEFDDAWCFDYGTSYDFDANRLLPSEEVPEWLGPLRARAAAWVGLPALDFASALIAEYRPGTPLGWHRDAPAYGRVAGVSLGGWARMRLRAWPARKEPALSLELAPRSAYRMEGTARWSWQHSISATRELRYSVTFRTMRDKAAGYT